MKKNQDGKEMPESAKQMINFENRKGRSRSMDRWKGRQGPELLISEVDLPERSKATLRKVDLWVGLKKTLRVLPCRLSSSVQWRGRARGGGEWEEKPGEGAGGGSV